MTLSSAPGPYEPQRFGKRGQTKGCSNDCDNPEFGAFPPAANDESYPEKDKRQENESTGHDPRAYRNPASQSFFGLLLKPEGCIEQSYSANESCNRGRLSKSGKRRPCEKPNAKETYSNAD